jgi:hypothetical protein
MSMIVGMSLRAERRVLLCYSLRGTYRTAVMHVFYYWMIAGSLIGFVYGYFGYRPVAGGPQLSPGAGRLISGMALAVVGAIAGAVLRFAWLQIWLGVLTNQ